MLKLKYCIAVMVFFYVQAVSATSLTKEIRWVDSSPSDPPAGSCTFTASDLSPLSQPLTLEVGNNVASTNLHQWNYQEFVSSVTLTCTPNGANPNLSPRKALNEGFYFRTNLGGDLLPYPTAGTNAFVIANTFNPATGAGVGMQFYATFVRAQEVIPYGWMVELTHNDSSTSVSVNRETSLYSSPSFGLRFRSVRVFSRFPSGVVGEFKIRAVLVKYSGFGPDHRMLYGSITNFPIVMGSSGGSNQVPDVPASQVFGAGGVRFVPARCRAVSQGPYVVSLSRWGAGGSLATDMAGPSVPVNIQVECTGGVNDVQFAFQDAGDSPQANGSVGLYDASGNKINGLEAEVRYNNTLISVGTSTSSVSSLSQVSVGPRSGGYGPYSNRTFSSAWDHPLFTINYRQRGLITRGGTAYLGPVSGRVNIFVTYN
ncbi:TPA: hypothetical protein ACSPZY_004110 [Aeromonas veronii]